MRLYQDFYFRIDRHAPNKLLHSQDTRPVLLSIGLQERRYHQSCHDLDRGIPGDDCNDVMNAKSRIIKRGWMNSCQTITGEEEREQELVKAAPVHVASVLTKFDP